MVDGTQCNLGESDLLRAGTYVDRAHTLSHTHVHSATKGNNIIYASLIFSFFLFMCAQICDSVVIKNDACDMCVNVYKLAEQKQEK